MKSKEDSFIGSTFPTPKGAIVTVVSSSNVVWRCKKYLCECSLCSKDKELFPNLFPVVKSSLLSGSVPCGCSKRTKWTASQNKVRIERKCVALGLRFIGFIGEYIGKDTKIEVIDGLTEEKIKECTVYMFLHKYYSYTKTLTKTTNPTVITKPTKSTTIKGKNEDRHIVDFINAGFSPLDTFKRSTTRVDSKGCSTYFDWTCHICSDDNYVKAGLCTGLFSSSMGDLKKGKKSCRCSPNYRYKEGQREFQIKTLLEKEGAIFLRWKTDSRDSYSKFEWMCSEGHFCETAVYSFVNNNARCLTCAQEAGDWGYYPDRVNEVDNLYLLSFKSETEAFLKVGRSFDVKERMREFLKYYEVEVITTYQNCHQKIFDTEQDIHSYLKSLNYHYTPKVEFGGSVKECFKLEALSTAEDIFYDLQLPIGFIE